MTPAALLGLVRPFTLLAPVVGVASAAAAAAALLGRPWVSVDLGVAFVAATAATAASNAWNQVCDVDVDRCNKPHRPIPSGQVSTRAALLAGDVLALAALLFAATVSFAFLACIAAGLLATWVYSAPPLRLKRRLVAALLAIALPRGVLLPVAGWAVVAPPDRVDPWALGLVAGLYVLGAAATKDFADVPGDEAHGCRTLPVVLGPKRAAAVVAPFLVLPFLLYPVLGAIGWLAVSPWRLGVLAAALALLGVVTARALLADPEGLAHTERGHPAWRGMYLLLLGSQVGTALVYIL